MADARGCRPGVLRPEAGRALVGRRNGGAACARIDLGTRSVCPSRFVIVGGYVVEELRFGNAHFFTVALMVLAYDRAESGKVLTPAVALAIAIATKITPLALLAYFVVRRRIAAVCGDDRHRRAADRAAGGCHGLGRQHPPAARLCHLRAGKSGRGRQLFAARRARPYLTPMPADVSHVEANIADLPMSVVNVLWLCGLAGLGAAALAAVWRADADPVTRLLEFSIVVTGIVLASPHTQRRYFVACTCRSWHC